MLSERGQHLGVRHQLRRAHVQARLAAHELRRRKDKQLAKAAREMDTMGVEWAAREMGRMIGTVVLEH